MSLKLTHYPCAAYAAFSGSVDTASALRSGVILKTLRSSRTLVEPGSGRLKA
jgi:hypothetical protein